MFQRHHLFEVNDSSWAPKALRDTIVESLSRTLEWGDMLSGLVAPFEEFVRLSGAREVIDVGAGAAGPARILVKSMLRAGKTPPRFILTDILPQPDAWRAAEARYPAHIAFEPEPVDATAIPDRIAHGRARVIINAFHHFTPELGQRILADAVAGSTGIFIAEAFDRNPLRFASFIPMGLLALAANPIMTGRDRFTKALLSLTPALWAASLWDGVVSTLRQYTDEELFEMVRPLGDRFVWRYGRYSYAPAGNGYYFFGVPR
jgi:hypothetical protein